MSFFEYCFGPHKDSNGRVFEFSRFDMALSVVLGLTLLAAISYTAEPHGGWTRLRIAGVLGVFIVATAIAQHRALVLGGALGIVTMRFAIGIFIGSHTLFFLICTAVGAIGTWLLLRDVP